MLDFHCISLMPEMFSAVRDSGITGRAFTRELASLTLWNPRDFTTDNYRRVDDRPYGGGPGMVMLPAPLEKTMAAVADALPMAAGKSVTYLSLSPQGRPLDHEYVLTLKDCDALVLLCGRYEGIDQRFLAKHPFQEVSVGDFVVSGGELPAMLLMDAVIRWLPGAMTDEQSPQADSFVDGLLDFPHYTRPEVWEGQAVPPVLLSGNHANIERWRREQALKATLEKRPDLLELARAAGKLSRDDLTFLASLAALGRPRA
jgi:tRNA (guanine37-N1)-methyltransferase